MGPRSLRKLFARELIVASMPEKGQRSQLCGWVLQGRDYDDTLHSYCPKYFEFLQAIRVFYEKEDIRYPPSRGYLGGDMLWNALRDARYSSMSIEDIQKKYKLDADPLLPIRRLV